MEGVILGLFLISPPSDSSSSNPSEIIHEFVIVISQITSIISTNTNMQFDFQFGKYFTRKIKKTFQIRHRFDDF
jgi:hypothetical protein